MIEVSSLVRFLYDLDDFYDDDKWRKCSISSQSNNDFVELTIDEKMYFFYANDLLKAVENAKNNQ